LSLYESIIRDPNRKFFVLTGLTAFLLLLVTALYPFTMDQSVYQTMAVQLVQFHRLPYVGSWDMNFPGIVFIHSLAILLFGNTDTGFRILDIIVHVGIVLMLYRLVIRWTSPRTAFIVSIVLCLLYISGGDGSTGQREGFAAFFTLVVTMLLYRIKDRAISNQPQTGDIFTCVVIGVFAACACWVRPTYGLFAVIIAVALWKLPLPGAPKRVAAFLLGSLILIAAVILPFASKPGALNALYLATIRFNIDIYGSSRYRSPLTEAFYQGAELFVDAVLLVFLIIYFALKKHSTNRGFHNVTGFDRFDRYLFIAYYVAARVSILVMGKFFRHHYEMLLILTSILLAFLLDIAVPLIKQKSTRTIVLWAVIVLFLFATFPWRVLQWFVDGMTQPGPTVEYVHNQFSTFYHRDNVQNLALTNYILSRTVTTDRVELCSENPEFIWKSEREPATRFTMIFPLVMHRGEGGFTDYQLNWRKEFVDSLTAVLPKYIVLAREHKSFLNFLSQPPNVLMHEIPKFDTFLTTNYQYDTTLHDFEIYRNVRDSTTR